MAKKQEVNTRVAMRNDTSKGVITFQEKNDWSGAIFGDYPHKIANNHTAKFVHEGVPPKATNGSMGGVIYVGPNFQGGPDKCAWVLAWSVPGDGTSPNRVYVECGDVSQYPKDSVDWDIIKDKLAKSGSKSESHDTNNSKAAITASIDADGNTPDLRVVFDVEN